MERTRFLHAEIAAAVLILTIAAAVGAEVPLVDRPVAWYDMDRDSVPEPSERDPNLTWDKFETTVLRPASRLIAPAGNIRRIGSLFGGERVPQSVNVNSLDEVPNCSWFTNRIGLFPMTPAEVAHGSGVMKGPSRDGVWTIVSAKTEGVTPGFNIRDSRGDVYVIKFDPPGFLGMTTAAGVISNRILHAAGYFVPEDCAVTFCRNDLVLADGVKIRVSPVLKRSMTDEDIDTILDRVDTLATGEYFAISSRFLKGTPLGPFDYEGVRKDDPNDRIRHQRRRELRGLRLFAAWLNHFDTKQANTLDMYIEENGRRYVRHHLIDFASTIGTGARGPAATHGFEYGFDIVSTMTRAITAGLYEDPWRRLERPAGLDEVGYFESYLFDPEKWEPLTPNSAFAEMTDRDGYWAVKIISAFSDEHLQAIVMEAGYRDPAAANYVARVLGERRDKIARTWFDKIPPLDFFTFENGIVRWSDIGRERGLYPGAEPVYRVRLSPVDGRKRSSERTSWVETVHLDVNIAAGAFIDMFVQRFAKAIAVGISLGITTLFRDFSSIRYLSIFTFLIVVVWIFAVRYAGRAFNLSVPPVPAGLIDGYQA